MDGYIYVLIIIAIHLWIIRGICKTVLIIKEVFKREKKH